MTLPLLPGLPYLPGLAHSPVAGMGVAPVNTVLPSTPTGTIGQGNLLTSPDTGTWTGTAPITYARQWFRADPTYSGNDLVTSDGDIVYTNAEDIDGANESTYTQTYADDGKVIGVRVTATNALGAVSATSFVTTPIYGPELAGNPDFDDASIWVLGANLSIAGGVLTAVPAPGSASQAVAFVTGTTYRTLLEVSARSGGDVAIQLANDANGTGGTAITTRNAVGIYEQNLVALSGNDTLRLRLSSTADLSVSRASARRVL